MTTNADTTGSGLPDYSDPRFDPAEVLDLPRFPDTAWAEAIRAGEKENAARRFARELREGGPRIDLDESIPVIRQRWFGHKMNELGGMNFDADDVVNLRYGGVYGIVHEFEDEIDWGYDGSEGRSPEWTWQFNRHLHWLNLADAYKETGDARYARAWERELRSWIAQMPRPDDRGRGHGSGWRTLDTGIRAGSTWPYAFEIFRDSPHVSDEAFWLFYCAQLENARHVYEHPASGNWLVMETNGLGQAGLFLRETKESGEFVTTALRRMREELDRQFFPDGTHQEFAPHYAAAGCLANFYVLARQVEKAGWEIDPDVWDSLTNIAYSLARIADPDGMVPGLHNSRPFSIHGVYDDFVRSRDPERFDTPPWLETESDLVPYGGYAVFRRDARFSIFDAGPRGTSHFHDDDLQLITWAYGRHFAIDPGSPLYTAEEISRHLRTSAAHNVVQMDGEHHKPAVEISRPREPMPISFHGEGKVQNAAARRTLLTDSGEKFDHERAVIDLDGFGWIVLDRLFPPDEKPRSWEWIWNLLVDDVETGDMRATASHNGGPAMAMAFAGSLEAELKVSKGETDPHRGWINPPGTDHYTPMPALRLLSPPTEGEVWLCTVKAPYPNSSDISPLRITGAREISEGWEIELERGEDRFRILFEKGEEQIGGTKAWKNGESLGRAPFGEDHVLREE